MTLTDGHTTTTSRTTRPRDNGRTGAPPNDLAAERAVLGALILQADKVIDQVTAIVTVGDFYKPSHAETYQAILQLHAAGQAVDPVTVAAQIERNGVLAPTTHAELVTLQGDVPSITTAARYALIVADLAARRRLHAELLEATTAAGDGDVDRALTIAARAVDTAPSTESSWDPQDLDDILDGTFQPLQPCLLLREDGRALVYPGKIHAFNAESESGKSWLALLACKQLIDDDGDVAYIDFEDDRVGVVGRLLAMGCQPDQIRRRFHYIRPDDPLDATARTRLVATVTAHECLLVVIDGITEVMVANGMSIKENDDVARLLELLPRPIARLGVAVIMIDHVPKDTDKQGLYAIGGQHKRAGIDGASFKLEVVEPFGEGRVGRARIVVTKDRHGVIRGFAAKGKSAGELRIASLAGGNVLVEVKPPATDQDHAAWRPTKLMEAVSTEVAKLNAAGIEPSGTTITSNVHGKATAVRDAIRVLVDEAYLTIGKGRNGGAAYTSTKPYLERDDPRSDRYEPPPDAPPEIF